MTNDLNFSCLPNMNYEISGSLDKHIGCQGQRLLRQPYIGSQEAFEIHKVRCQDQNLSKHPMPKVKRPFTHHIVRCQCQRLPRHAYTRSQEAFENHIDHG